MITKKNLFVLFSLCLSVVLTGCVDGGNKSSYGWYSVVGYNTSMGGKTLLTPHGELAVTEPLTLLNPGDCIFAYYTVDYDNQPSSTYYTATEVQTSEAIDQSYVLISEDIVENDPAYDGELTNIAAYSITSFWGKVIFEIAYTGYSKQTQSYTLTCNPNEKAEDGNMNLYLRAKKNGEESGNLTAIYDLQAFDLYSLIRSYGRDTTFTEGSESYSYKYIRTYINYCSKISDEGVYTYSKLSSTPSDLYVPTGVSYPFPY